MLYTCGALLLNFEFPPVILQQTQKPAQWLAAGATEYLRIRPALTRAFSTSTKSLEAADEMFGGPSVVYAADTPDTSCQLWATAVWRDLTANISHFGRVDKQHMVENSSSDSNEGQVGQ